ncbi:MAG: sensor histidine kinase [Microcoleaceae cyanobacterium]
MATSSDGSVLIVDDSPMNGEALSIVLGEQGFSIILAENGEDAIQQLQNCAPDLILMDVVMPKMDGFETCRRLKLEQKTQDIPVIFMTSLTEPEERIKGLNLGAVDFITKPFLAEEIIARVNIHLQLRNLNKNLEQQVQERTEKLARALDELKKSQLQLIQSEKMSALGQLVAGIGHEINNPLNFISGNLRFVSDQVESLFNIIRLYQNTLPESSQEIEAELEDIDLDYMERDLPKMIHSMQEGTKRMKEISTSLRIFSRSDNLEKVLIDLHESIDSTLMILGHRLKSNEVRDQIEVIKQYGNLPLVPCFPGLINQVFMNLLANSIDAIDETSEAKSAKGQPNYPYQILICTEFVESQDEVKIWLQDNAKGIPLDILEKIFEPLFTTKPVGKGTGLGLSISYQNVVEKHNGTLTCNSTPGYGAEFVITLPLQE